MHYISRWLCCYEVNVCMSFKHLTYLSDFILIISSNVSVPVLLQVQIAEAKITHVIQLKHTLDLVPQLKVPAPCPVNYSKAFCSTSLNII